MPKESLEKNALEDQRDFLAQNFVKLCFELMISLLF